MFGLSFEKLVVVLVVAAVIIGPTRLPAYATRLAELIRSFRRFLETSRERAEQESGVPFTRREWDQLVTQYDPRRIVREALAEPVSAVPPAGAPAAGVPAAGVSVAGAPVAGDAAGVVAPAVARADASPAGQATQVPPAAQASPASRAFQQAAPADATEAAPPAPEAVEAAAAPRYRRVGGSSGHPRRVRLGTPAQPVADRTPLSQQAPEPTPQLTPQHEPASARSAGTAAAVE
ncbi:MAG: twin-arginine translocase TatA/TatE family subunit [Microbacteriaceae bacterium]